MKRLPSLLVVCCIAAAAFAGGSWITWRTAGKARSEAGARKILYWVDPMHPSYKSDKPGIAPDCGMALEPVYADTQLPTGGSVPPNAFKVSPEKQQLIGVQVGRVERTPLSRTLATIGRVAVDDTRIYRIVSNADGWVRQLSPVSSGSLVRKDDPLLSLTAREVLTAEQTFFYGLWAVERYQQEGAEGPDQMKIAEGQVKSGYDALVNYGMGARQIEALRRSRTPTPDIEICSPVSGVVLARSVFLNQRYDRGTEFFRVADLSRVWVLADAFANDAPLVRAGMTVQVALPYEGGVQFRGRVSDALPTFDPASRTFKVRVEVDNARYLLRPDMFVDVRVDAGQPATLTVPVDALVDSGNRRVVFVDRGNGFFEPRTVEAGARVGDRVEILRGLMESERIVVSGNFLLDSEARMKAAAMGVDLATSQADPVCGMSVNPATATAAGRSAAYQGRDFYFCSEQCKHEFERDPARFGGAPRSPEPPLLTSPPPPLQPARPRAAMPATPPQEPAAIDASAPPPPPWPVGPPRNGDERPVPKNRRLRQSGGAGTPMQLAGSEAPPASSSVAGVDPVCGTAVDTTAPGALKSDYAGRTYYFATAACKAEFDKDPAKYAK
jgi:membrane fusion protein, copper/silver efflux system